MASFNETYLDMLDSEELRGPAYYLMAVTRLLTSPVIVLIRMNFGERYLNYPALFLYIVALVVGGSMGQDSLTHWIVTGLLIVMSCYHIYVIRDRNKKNIRWHSRYDGDLLPVLLKIKSPVSTLKLWGEPFLVIFLGFLIAVTSNVEEGEQTISFIALWFFAAAPFMVFLEKLNQSAARDAFLNAIDAQIESEHLQDALAGEPPAATEGFVVQGISDVEPRERERIVTLLNKGVESKMERDAEEQSLLVQAVSSLPPRERPTEDAQASSLPPRDPAETTE